jgi:hypothetical protein
MLDAESKEMNLIKEKQKMQTSFWSERKRG